ncbi:cobyrinate a,c-diamide synthase [Roseibium sediminicola]|uniref:Hydrogenobyrinate a,c-diamide synthase n=1 Tax=Roseibium sediminicola TaxID=2933272 RepID=A0ABT0H1N7_9HYPH|nr:cobyrinate a,c-diamide synthase [Roseibium sp. CAU 1639]MCK7615574.1 cobyrinate a,c-diamide synthase [Roseibium sp. CAU 1639]
MPADPPASRSRGLLIAAPSSGAGKTTLTLALLRALKSASKSVVSAKSGPDYIDPKFHEAASGAPCVNLDAWAMTSETLATLAAEQARRHDLLVVEGAMGLFDGAASGRGSAADLAATLGLPVVLVVDCAKQAQSVAALVHGFRSFRQDVTIAGVILNRVGSPRHEAMLRTALSPLQVEVLGALPRSDALILPERHLGLVQAGEHPDLDRFLDDAAELCRSHVDLERLDQVAGGLVTSISGDRHLPAPLGQRIAIARDTAFAFSYPHLLDFWRAAGADLSFFSPLANEPPALDADAIYLPGGYPELHAGELAGASSFKSGMRAAKDTGKLIYGECGGYMTLGTGLVDAAGTRHEMLGLLPLETSFQTRKRHLGYRKLRPLGGLPWTGDLTAHEFHYASIVSEGASDRLFAAEDAEGTVLAGMGLRNGAVMGSFAHVIASA